MVQSREVSHCTCHANAFTTLHQSLIILHHAPFKSPEKVICWEDMHCWAGTVHCWTKQDHQCAYLALQIIRHWCDYSRAFGKKIEEAKEVAPMKDMILKPPGQAGCTKGYSLLDELKLPKAHHAQILVCTRLLLVYACKLLSFLSENCQKNFQPWFRP